MAHNLAVVNGVASYVGRQAAWHTLGTVKGRYMTKAELLNDPALSYVVFKSQLRDGLGRPVDAWGAYRWNLADKVAGNKEAAIFLGVIGKDRPIIQHGEGMNSIDAIMQTVDGAHYETAGALGLGERVWALADLGLAVRIGDDVQKGFLCFATSHDSSMAHLYKITLTRVVCENTFNAMLSAKTTAQLTVKHTKNAMNRLIDARKTLEHIGSDLRTVEEKLNFIAKRRMDKVSYTSILDRLFPSQVKDDGAARDTTRRTNILMKIAELYESNDNDAFKEQRGTAYNLLNAITNYTDHERSSKDDGRAESAMFGSGDALKTKAMEVIYAAANRMQGVAIRRPSVVVDWADLGLNVPTMQ